MRIYNQLAAQKANVLVERQARIHEKFKDLSMYNVDSGYPSVPKKTRLFVYAVMPEEVWAIDQVTGRTGRANQPRSLRETERSIKGISARKTWCY